MAIVPKNDPTKKLFASTIILSGHLSDIYSSKFSPSGDLLASAGNDGIILIWDVFDSKLKNIACMKGHKHSILDIAWTKDSANIISASADRNIALWDAYTSERIKVFREHKSTVNSIDFGARGTQLILSGSDDCTVKLWDIREKSHIKEKILNYQITSVCFSIDNSSAYFGGIDNSIKKWDLRNDLVEYSLQGHKDTITGMKLSHDGNYLLTNSIDETLRIWDLKILPCNEARQSKLFFGVAHNFERNLLRCSWSKDNNYISAGSADKLLKIWRVEDEKLTITMDGHEGSINDVDFNPKQNILVSASTDQKLFVGYVELK